MPLTPEDVVNKRFQPTKFREGYDQDEVDDFLDEIVLAMRRVTQENEDLRQRLLAADGRIAELQRSGASLVQQVNSAEASIPASTTSNADFPQAASDMSGFESNNTNNLLQLARKLHEEHVREGLEKRDALIAEGHATASRIVRESEAQHKADLNRLEQEKALAENDVQTLRNFEKDYRAKLKAYIESQLSDLEGAAGSTQKPPTGPTAITNTYQI
ncbi:MAG: DivIVA domain-containing protein [Rhodoluna sp.]|jgi:DivIVA domain-containing protein|nr:DivIVA domain-containing protein [Rhodoluna sp.]